MDNKRFSVSDINDELLHYADMYLKKVIINAKNHYYRKKNEPHKHGFILVDFDECSDELGYYDTGYESALCSYINIKGVNIPVYNRDLFCTLQELTEIQRSILLQNLILNETLKQISLEFKISERMARKHKHNALEKIRQRMKRNYETQKRT